MSLADGLGTDHATTEGVTTVINITGYPPLREVERDYFLAVLESVGGNKAKAAKALGITVKSVYNKLYTYGAQGFGPYAIAPENGGLGLGTTAGSV